MFKNIEIEFWYSKEGRENKISFVDSYLNEDFKASIKISEKESVQELKLSIVPKSELIIEKLSIKLPYKFSKNNRIFVNGYQSWTDSREFFVEEKIRSISKLAKPVMNKYQFEKYGDYFFKKYSGKKGEFHGYTYSYIRRGKKIDLIGSISERAGFTIIEQYTRENKILINKECKGLSISKEYIPFELFYAKGSEREVFDGYFEAMEINKPDCRPCTGWTSWYNYYQNINEDIILENLKNFQDFNRKIDIFQIDDGYQTAVGDWLSIDASKFPRGMKYICESIKKDGYKAGIWLAPFVCETNSMIFKEKKEWILKDEKGQFVLGGSNWSRFYALDIYNPEVRDYIKNVFSVILNDWGYDMVKLDFLYAVCLIPRKEKTRGQIMTEAMEFLRECVGEKIILGCGVPLGPAFGLVDYCRIGCDVGLDWDNKFYMRKLHRERESTFNAIRNAIGRRHLNGRAFINDPDVFLLRDDNITLSEIQRETLTIVNNLFGSLLFTSDNLKNYKDKQFLIFDKAMDLKERTIENVESFRNGIVETVYIEEGKKFVALINLSSSTLRHSSPLLKKTKELLPYSSKIFKIEN